MIDPFDQTTGGIVGAAVTGIGMMLMGLFKVRNGWEMLAAAQQKQLDAAWAQIHADRAECDRRLARLEKALDIPE